jgi:LEA14-like dessication related protein
MRILVATAVFMVFGLMESGCSAAPRNVTPPRVTVQSLVAFSGPGQQRFRVTLLIDNTNTEPLAIQEIEFKLRLASEGIVDGRSLAPITVGALDQERLTLELGSDIVSSLSRLLSFVQGPDNAIPYDIRGSIMLDRRKLKPLRFIATGNVPLAMSAE